MFHCKIIDLYTMYIPLHAWYIPLLYVVITSIYVVLRLKLCTSNLVTQSWIILDTNIKKGKHITMMCYCVRFNPLSFLILVFSHIIYYIVRYTYLLQCYVSMVMHGIRLSDTARVYNE